MTTRYQIRVPAGEYFETDADREYVPDETVEIILDCDKKTAAFRHRSDLWEDDDFEGALDIVLRHVGTEIDERGPVRSFSFRGSLSPCGVKEPHPPHVRGHYDTVRYGSLQYFCPGVGGPHIHIIMEVMSRGSAETPGYARGTVEVVRE